MKDYSKKNVFIAIGSILITYIIVKIVEGLTGFHYDFSDGIVNIKLPIDMALWGCVYFPINYLLKKLVAKRSA